MKSYLEAEEERLCKSIWKRSFKAHRYSAESLTPFLNGLSQVRPYRTPGRNKWPPDVRRDFPALHLSLCLPSEASLGDAGDPFSEHDLKITLWYKIAARETVTCTECCHLPESHVGPLHLLFQIHMCVGGHRSCWMVGPSSTWPPSCLPEIHIWLFHSLNSLIGWSPWALSSLLIVVPLLCGSPENSPAPRRLLAHSHFSPRFRLHDLGKTFPHFLLLSPILTSRCVHHPPPLPQIIVQPSA